MLVRLVSLLVLLGIGPALARGLEPIRNYENVPVATGSGKPVTAEQVRQAIIAAGQRGKRQWAFAATGPDKLTGMLDIKAKRRIEVEVTYSAERFSVTYKSSEGWHEEEGKIHPNYNRLVGELVSGVRVELTNF